jgi:hypothetical protein
MDAVLGFSVVALALAYTVVSAVVCWQKGRRRLFWVGWLGFFVPGVGLCHLVGALRLARPDSSWALNRYGPEKLARSHARFTDHRPSPNTALMSGQTINYPY